MAKLQRHGSGYTPYMFIPIDEVEDVARSLLFMLAFYEKNDLSAHDSLPPGKQVLEKADDQGEEVPLEDRPCEDCTKAARGCSFAHKDNPNLKSCPEQYPIRGAY